MKNKIVVLNEEEFHQLMSAVVSRELELDELIRCAHSQEAVSRMTGRKELVQGIRERMEVSEWLI